VEKHVSIRIANFFRFSARYSLLTIGTVVFIFALLSGSKEYGGGISGMIKNSPNALPWLLLLILPGIAWKWELAGGILITALGLAMVFFFNIGSNNFYITTFLITILIPLFGIFFLISWHLRNKLK